METILILKFWCLTRFETCPGLIARRRDPLSPGNTSPSTCISSRRSPQRGGGQGVKEINRPTGAHGYPPVRSATGERGAAAWGGKKDCPRVHICARGIHMAA